MDTPSKFLNVGSNLNVSFHLDEVFALLKTPIHERERMRATMKNQPDTVRRDLLFVFESCDFQKTCTCEQAYFHNAKRDSNCFCSKAVVMSLTILCQLARTNIVT